MAIRHIKDGADFQYDRSFGFHGSAEGSTQGPDHHPVKPPFAGGKDTSEPKRKSEPEEVGGGDYAHGGRTHRAGGGPMDAPHDPPMGGMSEHPHGHEPMGKMTPHAMGGMCQHHAHGGITVHHPDGRMTHHNFDGSPAGMRHGGHHMAGGGSVEGQDMQMVNEANQVYSRAGHGAEPFGTESDPSQGGQFSEIHPDSPDTSGPGMSEKYARGGFTGDRPSLPRGMKPHAARRHSEIGSEMPMNKPPSNPNLSTGPRNTMPGGKMGLGVEPSAEPDMAGSEQGITGMKHGGQRKR